MSASTPHIAIFGGTFDPVHLGHMHVAEQVLEKMPVGEIRFIPCYQSPTRVQPIATAQQRLAMLKLATTNHPQYLVDDREIRREGVSYMIETLQSLQKELSDKPFGLILGMDAFAEFDRWREWQLILEVAHLILVDRPAHPATLKPEVAELLNLDTVTHLTIPPIEISATDIREKILNNQDITSLVPAPVCTYIKQHCLYLP